MNLLRAAMVATIALGAGTSAIASTTYVETFNEPFAGWENRFLGTLSNAQNYYRTEPSGAPADFRGGNSDGLWVSDGDNYTYGGDYGNVLIRFDTDFGARITDFSLDVSSLLGSSVAATLIFRDKDGAALASYILPEGTLSPSGNPGSYLNYAVSSTNGISGFDLIGFAQGNVSIDNVSVTAVPEPAAWAMMVGGFGMIGAAMRRRQRSTSVRFA